MFLKQNRCFRNSPESLFSDGSGISYRFVFAGILTSAKGIVLNVDPELNVRTQKGQVYHITPKLCLCIMFYPCASGSLEDWKGKEEMQLKHTRRSPVPQFIVEILLMKLQYKKHGLRKTRKKLYQGNPNLSCSWWEASPTTALEVYTLKVERKFATTISSCVNLFSKMA